jgi:hypothetical protein
VQFNTAKHSHILFAVSVRILPLRTAQTLWWLALAHLVISIRLSGD